MRDSQPLHLLREELVAFIAQHPDVKLVQKSGVCVHKEIGPLRVQPEAEWRLCARRSLSPSGLLCFAGRGFRGRGEGAAGDERRERTRSGSRCDAGGPDRSSGQIRRHGGRVGCGSGLSSEVWKEFGLAVWILPVPRIIVVVLSWLPPDLENKPQLEGSEFHADLKILCVLIARWFAMQTETGVSGSPSPLLHL